MLHNIDPVEDCQSVRVMDMKYLRCKKGVTLEWDKWYKPEQSSANSDPSPNLWRGVVGDILKAIGRPKRAPRPFTVTCNSTSPANATTKCDPAKSPCVFNITADPCEYYNLADALPHVTDTLHHRLQMYERTAIPPANKPQDPKGFPIHHGGIWVPWINISSEQETSHDYV